MKSLSYSSTQQRRLSSAATPIVRLDVDTDTLYVLLEDAEGPVTSILDDEEVFVLQDSSGRAVRLTFPNYEHFWAKHLTELSAHLQSLTPKWAQVMAVLFSATGSSMPQYIVTNQSS